MRITRNHLIAETIRTFKGNRESLRRAETEVVSGKRLQRPSDSPLETTAVLRLESRLGVYERYGHSLDYARTRMSAEEAVLTAVDDLLGQARDLVTGPGSTPTQDPQATREAIRSIHEQVVALANTRVGGEYIFAGTRTQEAPFLRDGTYVGDSAPRQVEIGDGQRLVLNQTGNDNLAGVMQALVRLEELSGAGPVNGEDGLPELDAARDDIRRSLEQLNGRVRQAEEAERWLVQDRAALVGRRQGILEADETESVLRLTEARNVLERGYAAVSRILNTSIFQFLK